MKLQRRQGIIIAVVVLVALSGCIIPSGSSDETPTDTPEPTQTPIPGDFETTTPDDNNTTTDPGETDTPTETPTQPDLPGQEVLVLDVIDGDTMDVQYENGTEIRVRLIGVDTPETHGRTYPSEYEGVPDNMQGRECLANVGTEASQVVSQLENETVRFGHDPVGENQGDFGRELGYIYLDEEETLNYYLVKNGYARVYETEFSQLDRFNTAEENAKTLNAGVWDCREGTGGDTVTDPDSVSLEITTVHADAEGNDNENLNDEYITIKNTGDEPIDMKNWAILDAAGHMYKVPDGVSVFPGEELTLRTGNGTDTGTTLYWGAEQAIWNNDGDRITIENSRGDIVLQKEY